MNINEGRPSNFEKWGKKENGEKRERSKQSGNTKYV